MRWVHGRWLIPLCLALATCAALPPLPETRTPAVALAPASDTYIDRIVEPAEARHPQQSGFHLVDSGREAFSFRLHSIAVAQRSIDVQTYIWHADATGAKLASALLEAADRGVKVRLMVDDMDARQSHYAFAGIAAHPNIQVRLFNPFASRSGVLSKVSEGLWRFGSLNRRMHNKGWIVDNRIALAGGRNIGDEYYGASEQTNFVDLDMMMMGPVVRDLSASFDRYWNASVSYPVQLIAPADVTPQALQRLQGNLQRLVSSEEAQRFLGSLDDPWTTERLMSQNWYWTGDYRFVSDDPLKITRDCQQQGSDVLALLRPRMVSAHASLWILSPYFVPGERGTQSLSALPGRGVDVRLITNSLAANDVVAVHGGYRQYRSDLLRSGVSIWEMKPLFNERNDAGLFGSSGASLHTKALVIDGEQLFVGSFNLDPRSTSLNTEQGVLVHSERLSQQLQQLFEQHASAQHAWRVTLAEGQLHWSDGERQYSHEPEAGLGRRILSRVISWLPLEQQL